MAIPRLIHQIWLGGQMPQHIKDFVQTIDDTNGFPAFEHIIWNEEKLAGEGIDIHKFDELNRHPAGQTGGLRLVLIERYGGIYMDCDVECIKPLDSLLTHEAFVAPQDHRLCNAVFGAIPHHPWIQWQLANTAKYRGFDPTWNVLLMDEAPRERVTVLPKDTFYPWLWFIPEQSRHATEQTLAIHHWDGSWGK